MAVPVSHISLRPPLQVRDKIFLEEFNDFDFGLNSKRNEINEELSI